MLSLSTDLDLATWLCLSACEAGERGPPSKLPCAAKIQGLLPQKKEQILRTVSSLCHTFIVLRGVGNGGGLSCLLNFSTTVVSFIKLLIHLTFAGQKRVFWYMFMLALWWFKGLGFIQLNHIE